LQVCPPGLDRTEVALDERADRAVWISPAAPQVLEVDLVVLDTPDREGQVDLQRANVRVDLVRGRQIDVGERLQDLVALVDVALVELVMRLNGRARDSVHL